MNIDDKVKRIMSMKDTIGEFSLDLYYNDLAEAQPYTAKAHSVINQDFVIHARSNCFNGALEEIEHKLLEIQSLGLQIKEDKFSILLQEKPSFRLLQSELNILDS